MIEASCHCGKVNIIMPNLPQSVNSCNCSACRRFGALWAYFEPKNVEIISASGALGKYSWGDKTITYHHCSHCGCVTHYTPTACGDKNRMAVNFRLAPLALIESVKIRYFDGDDTWKFIGE